MTTLRDLLEHNARHSPNRPALVDGERRWSHAEHVDRARRLSGALHRLGLRRQDRVSILSMNRAEFLEAYAAAQWGGFVLHAVNFRLAPPEMVWLLQDAEPRILLFEAQYADLVASLREQVPGIEAFICIGEALDWAPSYEALLQQSDGRGPPQRPGEDDDCLLAYTSGTTGRPKGVRHTHRSILRIGEVLSSELQLGEETRMLAIAPLFHAGASTLSWGAQFRGGCVVLHRGFSAPDVVRTIERERITAIHLVPTMVQALLDEPVLDRHDLSSLRMLMYAAAPMPVPLLRRAVEKFGPITWNGYGQTEINLMTVLRPHQHVLDGDPAQVRRLASVGQPHWQSAVRIVASDGSECETGGIGEVVARSETAMAGYWRNEAATQETIRDGWVSTGDLGYLDEDGFLFLVDRKKDLIISGGENVYSREVEDALALHPDVLEAAVIGVPDPRWGEAVKAILVPRDPRVALDAVEVIGFCRTQIAAYKCPKSIETIDALPRLNTGKVDKNALRARFGTPP